MPHLISSRKARHLTSVRSPAHPNFLERQPTLSKQTRGGFVAFHKRRVLWFVYFLAAGSNGAAVLAFQSEGAMLGYLFVVHRMCCVNPHSWAKVRAALRHCLHLTVLAGAAASVFSLNAAAQQIRPPAKGQVAELEAKTQTRQGDVTTADGDVDIRYADTRLRADHVEYNDKTNEATATGHVQLDYNGEHLEATEAHYIVSTGHVLPVTCISCKRRGLRFAILRIPSGSSMLRRRAFEWIKRLRWSTRTFVCSAFH
jgi:hypothetical protein